MRTTALLTAVSLPLAAALQPNVFFNWTFSAIDGALTYDPFDSRSGTTRPNNSFWNVTWSEVDEANYKPGDVGKGKPLMVGTAVSRGASSVSVRGFMTARNMTLYVSNDAYIKPSWPEGLDSDSASASLEVDNDRNVKYADGPGAVDANYTFQEFGNHSFAMMLTASRVNQSKLIVDHLDVGMGIQTEAPSFDAVKTRTESFVKDGAINPFFECLSLVTKKGIYVGNYTTTNTPVDLALLLGSAACGFNAPSNVSLLVLNGYSRPDGSDNVNVRCYPERPYPEDSFWSRIRAFKGKYVAPIVASVIVLDPTVQYSFKIDSPGAASGNTTTLPYIDYTALQSVTFYSGLADQEPPGGGGPMDWDVHVIPTKEQPSPTITLKSESSSSSSPSASSAGTVRAARASTNLLLAVMALGAML